MCEFIGAFTITFTPKIVIIYNKGRTASASFNVRISLWSLEYLLLNFVNLDFLQAEKLKSDTDASQFSEEYIESKKNCEQMEKAEKQIK